MYANKYLKPEPPDLKDESSDEYDHTGTSELTELKQDLPCAIKSVAVIKKCLEAGDAPAQFLLLNNNTNLNNPPSNWLRDILNCGNKQRSTPQWSFPKQNSTVFSSFRMANNFPDCIGEVDVVSDAENIKKLLKIPFTKSHISMMVHRVGKTLLLDDFDIHSHLLRASQKQWDWLRKFYLDHILETLHQNEKCLRKNKSRGALQNKNMLSKFLYYSLMEKQGNVGTNEKSSRTLPPNFNSAESANETDLDYNCSETTDNACASSPLRRSSIGSLLRAPSVERLVPEIDRCEIEGVEQHEFLRNVLWTFEDIRMLIGSDLPIFGGGTHPVVSLRLRDMEKPINILTGLDYWLDNLMCNVPEVVMCYHLNGIVQKYELLKTEDIPQMSSSSQFSPKVVKDIAQNVLSFLKSKATKSGHTYWLFKGKNEEVVKLYDLTTVLSSDAVDVEDDEEEEDAESKDSPRNPFTLPVAMLLYQVARNMKESKQGKAGTIFKLLSNCLTLIDKNTHPQVAASAHYLLADLFLPSDIDPSTFQGDSPAEDSDDTWPSSSECESDEEDKNNVSFSVNVDSLWHPLGVRGKVGLSDAEKALVPWGHNWEERCIEGLKQVLQGLHCLLVYNKSEDEKTRQDSSSPKIPHDQYSDVANPSEPIPLPFSPLRSKERDDIKSQLAVKTPKKKSDEFACCWALLLNKAAQLYSSLGQKSCQQKEYGRALQCCKIGLLCNDNYILLRSEDASLSSYAGVRLLSLAGDVHIMLARNNNSFMESLKEDFTNISKFDKLLMECIDASTKSKYSWSYVWPVDVEAALNTSAKCYQEGLRISNDKQSEIHSSLNRRLANVSNELGIFYMNQGIVIWKDTGKFNDHVIIRWNNSEEYLKTALRAFEASNDIINVALLNSNLGRLMRLWATALQEPLSEFSTKEKRFYMKSVRLYKTALDVMQVEVRENQPQHWEAIRWDLCTILFTMGTLLQDRAPLSICSQEEVEKEVVAVMSEALELCDTEADSPRQTVYQYRAAAIHHRLASLHHNAFRNTLAGDQGRKNRRLAAEEHYSKAITLFSSVGSPAVFLKALLEWMSLLENSLAGQTGSKSRIKTLVGVLKKTLLAKPMLDLQHPLVVSSLTEDEEESRETIRLILLLQQRLKELVESLVKAQSSGKSKIDKNDKRQWFRTLQLLNQERTDQSELMKLLFEVLQDIEICINQY